MDTKSQKVLDKERERKREKGDNEKYRQRALLQRLGEGIVRGHPAAAAGFTASTEGELHALRMHNILHKQAQPTVEAFEERFSGSGGHGAVSAGCNVIDGGVEEHGSEIWHGGESARVAMLNRISHVSTGI